MMKASNNKQMISSSSGTKLRSTNANISNNPTNLNSTNNEFINNVNNQNQNSMLQNVSPIAYSTFAITHNNHLIEYCRTSMSALAGSTAGIMGLTSLYGFAFYILMVVILWLMIMSKAGPNYRRYFTSSWGVLTNGFLGGLTTYVLFWTFLYGMVHVY